MQYLFLIILFLFGAAVGSFINVIADRFNTGLSWRKGRSFCFSCSTVLKRGDLVPIFSFLFLGGKCRYCESKIPISAFIVEILMGILSLLAAFKSGFFLSDFSIIHDSYFIIQYLLLTAIFAILLLITLYDLRHFIIPDAFLIAFFVFAFLHNSLFIIHDSFSYISYLVSLASGLAITFPFLAIFIISKGRWIGFGDIKYILVIGFWLGFASGLSAVILAFWIGAAFSIFALAVKRFKSQISLPLFKNNLTIKSEIPFGPFLSLGTIISFYFNADLFQIKSLLELF